MQVQTCVVQGSAVHRIQISVLVMDSGLPTRTSSLLASFLSTLEDVPYKVANRDSGQAQGEVSCVWFLLNFYSELSTRTVDHAYRTRES